MCELVTKLKKKKKRVDDQMLKDLQILLSSLLKLDLWIHIVLQNMSKDESCSKNDILKLPINISCSVEKKETWLESNLKERRKTLVVCLTPL